MANTPATSAKAVKCSNDCPVPVTGRSTAGTTDKTMIANIPTHARARATIVEKWPRSSLGLFSSQDLMGKPAEIKMVMNSRTMTTTDQTDKLALKLSLPVNVRISWPTLSMVSVISRREDRLAAVSPKSDQGVLGHASKVCGFILP